MCGRTWRLFQTLCAALVAAGFFGGSASAQDASLDVPPGVAPGAAFEVDWQGPDAPGDFIAIAAPDAPPQSFLSYARTSEGSPARLLAPHENGPLEVRYVAAAGLAVLAAAPIELRDGPAAEMRAPARVAAGTQFMVSLAEPGADFDFLTIVPAGAPDAEIGPYVRLRGRDEVAIDAPDAAGDYEIRHVGAAELAVLARLPVHIEAPPEEPAEPPGMEKAGPAGGAAITLTALLAVDAESRFRVAWDGPGGADDSIAIVPPRGELAAVLDSQPVADGPPVRLDAPEAAGEYEIVYIDGASGVVLARRELEVR